jgi:hypothetical protein
MNFGIDPMHHSSVHNRMNSLVDLIEDRSIHDRNVHYREDNDSGCVPDYDTLDQSHDRVDFGSCTPLRAESGLAKSDLLPVEQLAMQRSGQRSYSPENYQEGCWQHAPADSTRRDGWIGLPSAHYFGWTHGMHLGVNALTLV